METSQEKNNFNMSHKSSSPQSPLLELEREFNVPVETLFEAFASSESIKSWWWPQNLYANRVDFDFREGGRYFINMLGDKRGESGMTGRFEKIIPNEQIVMTDQFADKTGKVISPKEANVPGQWPDMVYITFDFVRVSDSKSKVRLSQEGIPREIQKDCKQGWSEMFKKLEAYLNRQMH